MIKKIFIVILISLLLFSSVVSSAGSSTRDKDNMNNSQGNKEIKCSDGETLKQRIKCRLENKDVALKEVYNSIEEACNDDKYKDRCQKLYKNSEKCYNQETAIEKKRCFLKESGINFNAKGTFRAAPNEAKRNYVVLLLYDLQERIEKLEENEKITSEQASSLIEKIVEIKRMILAESPRSEIVVKINEFKMEYKLVVYGKGSERRYNNSTNSTYKEVNETNVTN